MNIEKMLEAQAELDKAIFERMEITEYPVDKIMTAYRVELAEALQEWQGFKYWKLNRTEVDREKLLEELADCLHFALSLDNSYENEIVNDNFEAWVEAGEGVGFYETLGCCFECDDWVLVYTVRLGKELGYTLEELEEAYYKKNKTNYERIANNY